MTASSSGKTDARRLYARFTDDAILQEQGRLLFSLLHAFSACGYTIWLHADRPAAALGKYGALVEGLAGVSLVDAPPQDTTGWGYLYDLEDRAAGKRPWRRKLRVRFDLFSRYRFSDPIVMPFPMHPLQAATRGEALAGHRATGRQMRVFFSGDSKGYHSIRTRYPRPKLPRLTVVRTVLERLGDAVVLLRDPAALKNPGRPEHRGQCVIADPEGTWIAPSDWLATLARSDFFLSPPGIVMPMCHNIVEAMAVGTIPITNYPEWFVPPLEHLRTCIVFDGADDLVAKLRLALDMPAAEIARMKHHVIDYYETHLRPETFVARIEARADRTLTLLMYTERNTALNAKRLGRHAVLFRSAAARGRPRWKALITTALARQ
jgi:hypothetical protein